MINEVHVLLGETGKFILLVPGKIGEGDLVLQLHDKKFVMLADGYKCVEAKNINDDIMMVAAQENEVAVMEVLDPDSPPEKITHWAKVQDKRKAA